MITHPTIIARAGAPLADGGPRRRPVGRIGGMAGVADEAACNRLAAALGAGVQIVGEFGESLAADYDACFLDDRPIVSLDQWRAILTTGRLADVEGAFALAWREGADNLHLARDAVGERTLFYAPIPNGLIFASSLRAILMSGSVPRRLNLRAVAAYLSYAYLPGRETLVEGIFELLPGEQLNWSPAELQRAPFWELPFPPIDHSSEQEQALRLRALLEEAIRRRLPSPDEPVGAFLSGGLDSSLVVALARQLHRAPIHTYSVSFGAGHANELPFSSLVAEHCGTIHRVV
ncbi:MAG: asparagine synthase-related protein, partial [Verrucomicrobiota bacterium]